MPKREENKERSTNEALQEVKLEIRSLRAELSRLEGSILRERIKAVEEAMTQNRRLLYTDQLQEELDEDIEKLTNLECKNRPQCIERFKTIAAQNLKLIRTSSTTEATSGFDTEIEKIGDIIEKAKGSKCEICHQGFQKKLKREKRAFQTVVLVEKSSENKEEQINIPHLVETVLEPLANATRLKIVISLCDGKKSFSKLSQITSLRGGHLIFHLKKLLEAKLIAQEDNKGDYVVTERGIEAIKKVSLLQTR